MPPAPSQLASRSLAAEVKKKVRERGLVVWLDADGSYREHVDALATGALDFSYPVVPYRRGRRSADGHHNARTFVMTGASFTRAPGKS